MVRARSSATLTPHRLWRTPLTAEAITAFAVAVLSAQRFRLPLDMPAGVLVCILLLPVSLGALRRYRFAPTVALVAVLAAANGIVLTEFARGWNATSTRMMTANTILVLGVVATAIALLWARSIIGARLMVLGFGIGMLLSVITRGVNWDNPWKFTFSVPVILIVLSLRHVWGRRRAQVVALVALAGLSAVQDSRSLTGMLVVVIALLLTQDAPGTSGSGRALLIAVRVALVGIAGYFLVQAALLDGALGEQARARSLTQIERSGSLLTGGRPELGASIALLTARPWGYGSGVLPTGEQIQLAKTGMVALGYDPDNGYVNRYMFGNGFEVHSLTGDLWILFGVFGLALAAVLAVAIGSSLVTRLAAGTLSAVGAFLALRLMWDLAFSPVGSAALTLAVTLAVLLPRAGERRSRAPSRSESPVNA